MTDMETTSSVYSPQHAAVDAGKAARFLGVSVATIRRWADEGKLPSWRTPGGYRRFDVQDLEAIKTRGQA